MADAWHYAYTDFGEGRGRSPQPVLRAVVAVATPGSSTRFSAVIDTGGPITVVATEDVLIDVPAGTGLITIERIAQAIEAAVSWRVDVVTSGAAHGRMAHILDEAVEL